MLGSRLANRYQLQKELGRGGMGVVYLARDPHLDREVAIKVISVEDLGQTAEERFLREAQIVARMDHASIVPIYDLGRHEELLFFVMPVVQGETLQVLNRSGTLALADILEIVAQVADALDYSHQLGVVHRDIKPENIMVSRDEDALRARVMDFGLALGHTVSRLTRTGSLPGTIGYLSPEQILGGEIDGRSDLYSLGTILYECVTGRAPFAGSRYALLYQIVNEEPPQLAVYGVDPGLAEIVSSCLAKEPERRPARGSALAASLRRHAETHAADGLPLGRLAGLEGELVRPARPARDLFVGRDREMAELRRRLELAAGGECQLVLVGGEAGIGKTRLLEELGKIAQPQGFRVFRGRFSDQENAFPFQAFGELIQDFYLSKDTTASTPAEAMPDVRDLEADLKALFPALSELEMRGTPQDGEPASRRSRLASSWVPSSLEPAGGESESGAPPGFLDASDEARGTDRPGADRPGADRPDATRSDADPLDAEPLPGFALAAARRGDPTHLFELLAVSLSRLAAGRPTVYLLEHLHGASISIDALQYIVRRLGPTPSLFVGSYRPSDMPRRHPLGRLLASVRDEPRFAAMTLKPLDAPQVRQIVAAYLGTGELSQDLADKLNESTEGNPFFTLELVRSLVDAGEISRDSSGLWNLSEEAAIFPGSLPETIQQAVEARLERLPDEVLEVLKTASVLGRSFEYRDLEALVGEAADEAVERLLGEGLLEEDRQVRGDRLQFTSGVVRDALHGDLSRRRRRMLHRRHARLLEDRYSGRLEQIYPRLVHHYAAGDVAEKTVDYALKLARRSLDAVGVNVAVNALRTALDFVEDDEIDRETEGEVRFLLARALRAAGTNESAVKEAARAVRVFERIGETAAAARAALLAAETSWQGRRVGETRRWVEKGIELARASDSAEVLRKLLTLGATVANLRGEYQKARSRWEEAQELGVQASPAAEPLPAGGTLVASAPSGIVNLDPRQARTIEEKEVLANIFEPLVGSDTEAHLKPGLCEDWERSADSRTFTLHLRRDVCFSDGTPCRAEDVRRSLTSTDRPRLPPACAALTGAAEHFARGSADWPGIEVVDDYTLRFHLDEPTPIFPVMLSDLNTAVYQGGGDGPLVGTGPFAIEGHRGDAVRLARNDHYWRGAVALLDAIELRTYLDSASAAVALRSGELDVGHDFRPEELDLLLRDPRFRAGLVETTRHNVFLLALNLAGAATRQLDVRRALLDVIRVQDAVWQTLGRFAQPASCLIPPGILGHDPGRRRDHLSREEARRLLEASGLDLPVTLSAAVHPLLLDRFRGFTDAVLREWETIGVRVVFANTTRKEYIELSRGGTKIDLWMGRWVGDYDDPDNFTFGLLHSERGFIGSLIRSEAIDRLAAKARQAERVAVRQMLYRRLEGLLFDERVLLPLFNDIDYRLTGPRIRGLRLLGRPPYVCYSEVAKLASAAAAQPERDSGVIHIPFGEMYGDLAPRQAQILGNAEIVGNVFETLTRLDEGARIVPQLASEFRLEEGGRRFRFKLRSNVRFHDGRKLTVRDVRFTFEELIRGLGKEAFEANLVPIRGGRRFWDGEANELEGFVIRSANEFLIDLERPLSFFPVMLTSSSTAIVPEGTRRYDGNWRDGTVGTGPFRVVRFDPEERLELEAHPHYWRRDLPRCDRLVFELGFDRRQVVPELRAGRFALASQLTLREIDELLLDSDYAPGFREIPGFSTCFLILDTLRGPLSDAGTRASFKQLVDAPNLTRAHLGRLAAPAQGIIPPGLLGHEPRAGPPPAQGTERSDPRAPPLEGLTLRVAVISAFTGAFEPFWEALSQALERAGARLKVVESSPIETLWGIAVGEIDVAAVRWAASYPDPDALIHFFHSRGYLGGLVGLPELDELFDHGREETDPALRHTLYRRIDRILARSDALVPLFHEQIFRVGHPELRGLRLRFGWPEVAYEELTLG